MVKDIIKERDWENEIRYCYSCYCMSKTKRGYIYICGKCGKDRRQK